jgi:hypothetical protein
MAADRGHDAAGGLDAEGEGRNVDEDEVLEAAATRHEGEVLPGEDAGLHCGAEGDGLVGVDVGRGLLAVEEVLEQLPHLGDAGGAADENDLVHLLLGHAGIFEDVLHGDQRLFEEVQVEFLELGARELLPQVLARLDVLHLDGDLHLRAENALRILALPAQAGDGGLVGLAQRHAGLGLELLRDVSNQALVKVLPSKMGVPVRRQHLEHPVVDRQE